MADSKTDRPDKYLLQVAEIVLLHPMRGDKIQRNFVGKAFMDPDAAGEFDRSCLVVGEGNFSDFMRLDKPKWDEDFEAYMQVAFLTIRHPLSDDEIERAFIGRAFFEPEELEEFGSLEAEKIFYSINLNAPYNPYSDDDNVPVHRHKTDVVRQALAKEDT